MNTQSIPVVAMASISLYVGLYHFLLYFRRRQHRENLTFALLCFSAVFYDAFCVGLYNATSVIEGAQWQRAQLIALAVLVPAYLWFVSDYTRQKPGLLIYAASTFYLLAIVVQLVDRSDLTWLVNQPSIKHIVLPFGSSITYYELTFGPFTTVQSLLGMVFCLQVIVMGVRYFRRGNEREAMPLLLATGLMYAAAFHDTMVSNGLYDFIYLMEYAYLGIIVLMAYSLSNMVVEAAIAKDALRESEEKFRLFVEQSSDGLVFTDEYGIIIEWNQAQERLSGIMRQESVGQPVWQIQSNMLPVPTHSPESRQRLQQAFLSALQSGHAEFLDKPMEIVLSRRDGTNVVVQQMVFGIKTNQGYRLGSISRDITQLKLAEEGLKASEERYRRLVEVSPIPMWINKDGIITYMNPAALQVLGATHLQQVTGRAALDFIHPDYHGVVSGRISQMMDEEKIVPLLEEKYVRLDGSVIDVEVIATPFTTSGGRAMQVLFQDITKRKLTEAEREALIVDLEAKNAELERFAYSVSHDLKAPLVTIRGFLGFLENDVAAGDIERFKLDLGRIADATDKMQQLLQELLDFARIGHQTTLPQDIPFEELVNEALNLVRAGLDARGVKVQIQPGLPIVHGDKPRLVEVLQNLLDNAAKFMGDQPGPQVEIGQDGEENGAPIFYVRDNGMGIAPEYHDRIFGLFNKLDPQTEGTGIGLALVKRIIEFHGGRIWVEGKEGVGATFYFTLPVGIKGE